MQGALGLMAQGVGLALWVIEAVRMRFHNSENMWYGQHVTTSVLLLDMRMNNCMWVQGSNR